MTRQEARVRAAIAKVGCTAHPGSSLLSGIPYQPLPFPELMDLKAQRPLAWLEWAQIQRECHRRGWWPGSVLDLGANVGMHTWLWADIGTSVLAAETDPANLKVLEAIRRWKGYQPLVQVTDCYAPTSDRRFGMALCLNVHQWFNQEWGRRRTTAYLKDVAQQSEVLVFQTAHAGSYGKVTVPWLRTKLDCLRYVQTLGKKSVEIIGESGYKSPRYLIWAT